MNRRIRFALRTFRRTPLTTATMVAVLALGIGVNTATYSVLSAITRRPPAGIPRDNAIVWVRTATRYPSASGLSQRAVSLSEYREYAARTDVFSSVAGYTNSDLPLDLGPDHGGASAISTEFVTPNYFSTLGIRPMYGPGLSTVEDPANPNLGVVISEPLWRLRFGGTADVAGKTLRVNAVTLTIVGVAPPLFRGPSGEGSSRMIWILLGTQTTVMAGRATNFTPRDSTHLNLFAHLQKRVTPTVATPVANAIAQKAFVSGAPKRKSVGAADVVPLRMGNQYPDEFGDFRIVVAMMASISLLVLVITCLNVSALLIGSAFGRRAEIAIRLSIGAPRWRIVRQLLAESSMVAISGGLLGLLLLWWIEKAIAVEMDGLDISIGSDTVLFTMAIAVTTGLVFGISPALHATRESLAEVMKRSATAIAARRSRLQRGLVVAQIAFTQPLLLGLGVILGDVMQDMGSRADPGIRDHLIEASSAWVSGQLTDTTHVAARAMLDRFRAIPGIVAVIRMNGGYNIERFAVRAQDRGVGAPTGKFDVRLESAGRGYFAMMGIPFVRGRDFTEDDERLGSAVIIDSDLATKLWGTIDPVGKGFQSWSNDYESFENDDGSMSAMTRAKPRDRKVVGVVDAGKAGRMKGKSRARVFMPVYRSSDAMLIRTLGPGAAMIPVLRQIANREFPNTPMSEFTTLAQQDSSQRHDMLMGSSFAGGAGGLILLMASIGLYGVVAFAVGQRTREIGIRLALGATPRGVVALFFREGIVLGAVGLAIGLPLSVLALRLLPEPVAVPQEHVAGATIGIGLVVTAVAGLATWLPARRAARVNPLLAIRAE